MIAALGTGKGDSTIAATGRASPCASLDKARRRGPHHSCPAVNLPIAGAIMALMNG
jgi:hypothetical protein